jgi:hypothetical protein
MPSAAIVVNQTTITGPKSLPTSPVPSRWIEKSATRMAQVSGSTSGDSRGLATASPSTALRTEIAGVITPSPYNSEAPITASSAMPVTLPLWTACVRNRSGTIATRAKIPPSPLWSARMTHVKYLTVTTMMSAQNISERIPNRSSTPAFAPPAACKHSFKV